MAMLDATLPYDPVDYLQTPEDLAEYVIAAIEDGNDQVLLAVRQDVDRFMAAVE